MNTKVKLVIAIVSGLILIYGLQVLLIELNIISQRFNSAIYTVFILSYFWIYRHYKHHLTSKKLILFTGLTIIIMGLIGLLFDYYGPI